MGRFRRAFLSHNELEWWYHHLTTALSRHLDVSKVPMMRFNQPGHSVDADVTFLVGASDPQAAFYMGSVDQLFAGIPDLPLPTAVWIDWFETSNTKVIPCFRLYDVVFSSQKDAIPALKRYGMDQVEWLPFAFDTAMHNDPSAEKIYDVGFVGSLDLPATRGERLAVLSAIATKYRLNDYRTPAYGDEMMRVYNQSRIVVNIPAFGGLNMRTFETLASGALLLTKAIGNGQEELFEPGVHFVSYRDTDDLMSKIDYYLQHESERRHIADAGRQEVLARHTYDHRAQQVLDVMQRARRVRAADHASRVAAYAAFYDYLGRADLLASVAFDRGVPPLERLRLLARAGVKFGRSVAGFRKRGGVGRHTASPTAAS